MNPTKDYVLVQTELEDYKQTEAGVFIAAVAKSPLRHAKVIAHGPDVHSPGIKARDAIVFFVRGTGIAVGDGRYLLSEKEHIVATGSR